MFEYQTEGINWLTGQERRYLGDEPGLGKTRQLILAAEGQTLVVGPAMLEGVWVEEVAKWRPELHWAYVPYSRLCDTERGPRGGTKTLPRLRPHLRDARPDTLIFDEAHYLKGRNTNWTKAALRLADQSDTVWQASGTPIPNWAQELFIPAQILHPGDRRFTAYWRWAAHWFKIWHVHGGRKVADLLEKWTWEQFHEENLGDLFLQRTWDELEDQLPPLRRQTIEVDMTPAQKRFYSSLKKDFVADMESGMRVIAWNDGAKATQLAKASFGLEAIDPLARNGSGKLAMGKQLLDSWADRPCILVTYFQSSARAVERMARAAGRDVLSAVGLTPEQRYDVAHRFQCGQGDTLVATVESIAEGLTLTRANRMCFFEKAYRPSRNTQCERRIWRLSQTEPCLVVDLVARQSVDQRVRSVLEKKTDQQMRALTPKQLAALL